MRKIIVIFLILFFLVSCQTVQHSKKSVPYSVSTGSLSWELVGPVDCTDDMSTYFECASLYANGSDEGNGQQ